MNNDNAVTCIFKSRLSSKLFQYLFHAHVNTNVSQEKSNNFRLTQFNVNLSYINCIHGISLLVLEELETAVVVDSRCCQNAVTFPLT